MKPFIPLLFLAACSTQAFAHDEFYIGAILSEQETENGFKSYDSAGVLAGFQLSERLAIEGRFSSGSSGYRSFYGSPSSPRGRYTEDLDWQAQIFLKGSMPLGESLSLYGLFGFTQTQFEATGLSQVYDVDGNWIDEVPFSRRFRSNGFGYGVGAEYRLTDSVNIFLEHQVLPDFEIRDSDYKENWESTSVGFSVRF